MLTLGSLFDGIGGWQLAAIHNGVKPVWSSEVEAFPIAVTKKHFPDTLQLGDITKLNGAEIPPVDIICAGSPCQDLSVAGKQEGLKGERSGLFLRAVDIVRRMRDSTNGKYPRFFVWENVPGAFSSNSGADFRAVLEKITETEIPMPENNKWADAGMVEWDGGSLAWRVLDAQYWGVPQRRRRIFLVADFTGQCAGEILFERESVRGDSSESGEAREGLAAGTESGIGSASGGCLTPWGSQGNRIISSDGVAQTLRTHESGGNWSGSVYVPDKARSLTARNDGSPCIDRGPEVIAFEPGAASRVGGHCYSDGKAPTLRAEPGDNGVTIAAGFKAGAGAEAGGIGYQVEQMPTLTSAESGTQRPTVAVYDMTHADEVMRPVEGGKCQTLNARMGTGGNQVPVLAFREGSFGQYEKTDVDETTKAVGGVLGGGSETFVSQKSVRRLTPTEAERLQGLPDGYTLIDDKTCSDTARYKALGNGMAQPCADYVIRRIVEVCGDAT